MKHLVYASMIVAWSVTSLCSIVAQASPVNFPWQGSNVTFQFRYPVTFPDGAPRLQVWRGNGSERCDVAMISGDRKMPIKPSMVFEIGDSEVSVFDGIGRISFRLSTKGTSLQVTCNGLTDTWEERLVRVVNSFIKYIGLPQVQDDEVDGVCVLPGAPRNPVVRPSTCQTRLAIFCQRRTLYHDKCVPLANVACAFKNDIDQCVANVFDIHLNAILHSHQTRNLVDVAFDNAVQACK